MPHFTKKQVFILPHAEEYRKHYGVGVEDVLTVLNEARDQEGLATDHYTASSIINGQRITVDFYITLSLQYDAAELYAIVDYVGSEGYEPLPD